jgi:MFS-type transporter involved in bile tolerance (Atg22 family)
MERAWDFVLHTGGWGLAGAVAGLLIAIAAIGIGQSSDEEQNQSMLGVGTSVGMLIGVFFGIINFVWKWMFGW